MIGLETEKASSTTLEVFIGVAIIAGSWWFLNERKEKTESQVLTEETTVQTPTTTVSSETKTVSAMLV